MLYKSLVRPHLEYGNLIWRPFNIKDIKLVESVQRRATKLVPNLKDLSYPQRLQKLNIPSLVYRRRIGDMTFMYKLMTGKINLKPEDIVMFNGHTRGHEFKVMKKKALRKARTNVFSNRIVNEWNNLPSNVIKSATTSSFKSNLDKHCVNQRFDYVD